MNPVFFVAPVSIAGISALLALLISATDKIVNNYGDVVIDINQGKKELEVKGGAALMGTLAESGIFVPSACGGRGSCGACKVVVKSDVGPVLPTEAPYLTKEEIEQGVRLSCQIKLKADIGIEIPDALFNIKKLRGTIKKITDLTHDIKEVLVELPEGESVDYVPGQYMQLEVPGYDKIKEPTMRAYSLSSTPSDKGHVEFLIRLVPGGIVTTYVHEHLKEGEKLNVVGPFGDFYVQDNDSPMICVAGGSGMAPFKSIFNHMIETGEIETRDVWYFFGARAVRDMFYLDWLRELDKKYEHFHFIAALSEPLPEDHWEGETGLITDVLAKYLETIIPDEQSKEGYLCGSPGMLDACMAVMRKYKMQEEKIYFDKFA
ncbi:NADH:ubiquinone reductase (Na(+)-transporting) subunit F [Spirochaeta africana]|uniref:Na+-transporting NADH:ubiquinone oxidoreductase, subunit NqrF n=1 Tax=Spirochaeta africana (strain ATCC 700263 / DSM 8902 / Z-7692) TaxID=889378 RepID=H9UK23_SPIAZ|nr:2Fe-2S iron-sulfur cluster binding domain-containing protein [Spirochaeta africana]AFG37866.1 Na+-transporting NADH:ubiquinone oxidoreductase, subunit NqrF [Spirochaeta africana DSM 8902]